MKRFLCFAAMLSLLAVSCKEEIKEDILEVAESSTLAGVEGSTSVIKFTANNPWTISAEQAWITFDVQSGDAGTGAVNMTVAANDTYEGRSSKVTLKAGSKSHVISVSQLGKSEFGTSLSLSLTSEAQDITIPVVGNVDYTVNVAEESKGWLTVVKTKAAPVEGEIVLHVSENTDPSPRNGSFEVVADNYVQKYVVVQSFGFTSLASAEAIYLGSLQDIYDYEASVFNTFRQYAVILTDENMVNSVALVLNAGEDADKTAVPAGEYTVDATGKHAAGTFSLKSTSGHEKYYTAIAVGEEQLTVIDGEVSVSLKGGVYTVTALLQDADEAMHSYSYQGEIPVEDGSFGAECTGYTFKGQYNTYFASKAQEWSVSLMTSGKDSEENPVLLRNIYLTVYGTESQTSEIPVGDFTYAVPEEDESLQKPNGITKAVPQTFDFTANDGDWATVLPTEGTQPSLKITKNDDGTYDISFSGSFVMTKDIYDDNEEFVDTRAIPFVYDGTFEDVYFPEPEAGIQPTLDGGAVLSSVFSSQYYPYYYGHVFDEANDVFYFGFTNVNDVYTVNLSVNVLGNYVFVKDFRNRFCSTPFGTGTFTYSQTAVDNALIPLAENNAPRLYIENTYTGTRFYVTGGSITLTDKTITYDLTAKPRGGEEVKFTGTHDASFYFAQDYTSRASACNLLPIE